MKMTNKNPTPALIDEFYKSMMMDGYYVIDTSFFFDGLAKFERGIDYQLRYGEFANKIEADRIPKGMKLTTEEIDRFNSYMDFINQFIQVLPDPKGFGSPLRLHHFGLRVQNDEQYEYPHKSWNDDTEETGVVGPWHYDGGQYRSLCPLLGNGTEYKTANKEILSTPLYHTLFITGKDDEKKTLHRRPGRKGLSNLLVLDYVF